MAYDYVLAGGGSAGCELAARLSEITRHRLPDRGRRRGQHLLSQRARRASSRCCRATETQQLVSSRPSRSRVSMDARATSLAARRWANRARSTA